MTLSPDLSMQVYVALSAMLTWGMMDEEVNLSSMYDLLRQQFQNPNDPWVKETLQWWDRCVLTPSFRTSHHSRSTILARSFRPLPTKVMALNLGT